MGGCVGSHHDSSGSLNENSDGTGGCATSSLVLLELLWAWNELLENSALVPVQQIIYGSYRDV
ncbi:hypothetical protein DV515_00006734 [Chloebia gouldiae]|uniref:Uncharacterized protein n=1 Tax=Chloebia gouldiae TaxID=44316 RepID=A0A3L8SJD3_CHLGU|nr:hypothetical protein DV515_00006734 [Chloebia gouldiae]